MSQTILLDRRKFLITSAVVAGALAISVKILTSDAKDQESAASFGVWLSILQDGTPVLTTPKIETGNGTNSSMAMFLCEELDCDPSSVRLEEADINRDYREGKVISSTGGYLAWFSGRSNQFREAVQQAGASARERLKKAAADRWDVAMEDISSSDGTMRHAASGRSFGYGELALAAASVKLPEEPQIKKAEDWTLIGKRSLHQLNSARKVDGSGVYGIDVQVPGMLYASVLQAPVQGAQLRSFNAGTVRTMPGVKKIVLLGPKNDKSTPATRLSRLRSAIVVVADHYWNAKRATDAIEADWDEGAAGAVTSETIRARFRAKLDEPSKTERRLGDFEAAMAIAATVVEADYEAPYQEHAAMEPLNATAHFQPDRLDLWAPTQKLDTAMAIAVEESGLKPEQIFFHPVMVGGQFGRRNPNDETRQAVAIAMAVGKPVKLIWSREEVTRQGAYRPYALTRFRAGLGPDGFPNAWFVRQVGHSYQRQLDPDFDGFDVIAMRPIATETEYSFDNVNLECHNMMTHVLVNSFRGSGATFQVESFIDEIAHAGGADPVELRRWLLRNAKDPGWLKVLNEVAEKSKWGKPLPRGRAQGIAINLDHGTITGQVAEVSVSPDGKLTVHSIDVAFDVGTVINPEGLRAQMEGGILFGLSNTLREEITFKDGRVEQSNFHDYEVLRMAETPEIRVHFGGNTGGKKLEPCGETPVPPVAPAICNAIFRATGKRVRSIPLKKHDLSWS